MGLELEKSYMPEMKLKEVAKVKAELEKKDEKPIEFVNGNFKMNPKLWDAYLKEADNLMAQAKKDGVDLNKTSEWGNDMADLNKDGKVSREELAATIFARASRTHTKINKKGELVVSPDVRLDGVV